MMQLSDFEFVQLTKDTPLLPFVSVDEDLNNFLTEDAKNYSADLMAVTYLFIDKKKQQIAAYFSLLNDKTRLMYLDLKPFKDNLEQGI
ncbi:MAG: hypothetical protein IJT12_03610 [Paludibacteraceae bacterium]|nr:hypothetical protein [Paludibacteraceae bacterium]